MCTIEVLLKAWSQVCTVKNSMATARKTGTFPIRLGTILRSPFIQELTPDEQRLINKRGSCNRLSINAKNISDPLVMNVINSVISQKVEFRNLFFR